MQGTGGIGLEKSFIMSNAKYCQKVEISGKRTNRSLGGHKAKTRHEHDEGVSDICRLGDTYQHPSESQPQVQKALGRHTPVKVPTNGADARNASIST